MDAYKKLKSIWKKLGINGQVKNYSSKELWTQETDSGKAIAHRLPAGYKTPRDVDCDAFKRTDGKPIDGHGGWWKFYDFSTAEVFDKGADIQISVIKRVAVGEDHFGTPTYKRKIWGSPIQLITDVKRNRRKQITAYRIDGNRWLSPDETLTLTCRHEIDNARPVFPKDGRPYIRTRRDDEVINNISVEGRA